METQERIERRIAVALVEELFAKRMADYRSYLGAGDPDKALPVFAGAMRAFRELDTPAREALLAFLAVPLSDAASLVLGMIDGSSFVDDLDQEFNLEYGGSRVYLQDDFLGLAEEQGYLDSGAKRSNRSFKRTPDGVA